MPDELIVYLYEENLKIRKGTFKYFDNVSFFLSVNLDQQKNYPESFMQLRFDHEDHNFQENIYKKATFIEFPMKT